MIYKDMPSYRTDGFMDRADCRDVKVKRKLRGGLPYETSLITSKSVPTCLERKNKIEHATRNDHNDDANVRK